MTFPTDSRHRVSRPAASRFSPTPVRADAKAVWSLKISGKEFDGQDVVFDGDRVFVIRDYMELVALELKTGEIAWQQRIPFVSPRAKKVDVNEKYELRAMDGVLYLDGGKTKLVKKEGPIPYDYFARPGSIDARTGEVIQDADWYPGNSLLPLPPIELGDWLIERDEEHRFLSATHRVTGETSGEPLPGYEHLDISSDLRSTLDVTRMIAFGKAGWAKQYEKDQLRALVFQSLVAGEKPWEVLIDEAMLGADIETGDFSNGSVAVWRGLVTVHTNRSAWGSAPFLALDRTTGALLWRGRGLRKFTTFDNRALLEPPEGSRDLLLLEQFRPFTCEVRETSRIQERDFWREKGTGDPAMAEFETIKTFDEPDMPERMQKKELVFYEFSHRVPMSGNSWVISAVDPLTGEEVWSTEKTLTTPFEGSDLQPGVTPIARSGNTLWVRHRVCTEGKRKNDRATYKVSANLVALDYNTGEVLSQRKCADRAEFAGIHDGHLILKEGRKLVCYA